MIDEGYRTRKELCEAEIFLIAFYRELGMDLVISSDGGESGSAPAGKNHPNSGKKRLDVSIRNKGNKYGKTNKGKSSWCKGKKSQIFLKE